MKKIIDFMKTLYTKIATIIVTIVVGVICAILPAVIMYGGNQTPISRIEKFGAESPQGIEAIKIANGINIVCGIILGIIAIVVVIAVIQALFGKFDYSKDSIDHDYSNYDYNMNTSNSSNNSVNDKSFDFDVKTSYVTDNFGNVVGKVQTTSYSDKYGGFEKKEILDNMGNKQGQINTNKW